MVKEIRLQRTSSQQSANAWLQHLIRAFNRRFAVVPSVSQDAIVSYAGTEEALRRILSIHTFRRPSKKLSCQFEGLLYQVQTTG